MNLPVIPNGWRLLEKDELVLVGDMWSYYSSLSGHGWLRAKYVNEPQLGYNVYIRKVK